MTLTELLIVVAVLVILTGLALPMLKTGLEGRRIREASRQLNTYAELAKSQAAETGRPAGLILDVETLPENGRPYVSKVFLAQTPLPYVGDMVTARAEITGTGTTAKLNRVDNASLPFLVRLGDQIRFDYRGVPHTITHIDNMTDPVNYIVTFAGSPFPPTGAVLPYQIYRQPEKSGSMPLELAPGAVIDLSMSGFGLTKSFVPDVPAITSALPVGTYELVSGGPILIQFDSTGSVPRIGGITQLVVSMDSNNQRQEARSPLPPPTATLHLLVGRIDGVLLDNIGNVNVTDDLETNIENAESLWVSIGHQTGHVTTAENGWTLDDGNPLTLNDPQNMALAREFAQSGKAMGGR